MPLIAPIPGDVFKSALVRTRKKATQGKARTKEAMIRRREIQRVEALGDAISAKLITVQKNSANFSGLSPFITELAGTLIDIGQVKRALHSVKWGGEKVVEFKGTYVRKMRGAGSERLVKLRKEFERRTESVVKKVSGDLKLLEKSKKKLEQMPGLREMPTVIIAGCPNTGKSTLLRGLTGSKVAVAAYPFTTKKILIGYLKYGYKQLQLVDTPGMLDRPFAEMNDVEKRAAAALKHLSRKVVFVLDISEACGYSVEAQFSLLDSVKRAFNPEILVVSTKKDLATKEQLKKGEGFVMNATDEEEIAKLKDEIISFAL